MTFYSEATMMQNLALLERIFQASWEMHLLFSTACGLPNRDLARPDHIVVAETATGTPVAVSAPL